MPDGSDRPNTCRCYCHDGVKVFCSCWVPCCQEPRVARAALKALPPPQPPTEIGNFMKFVFPVLRQPKVDVPVRAQRKKRRKA